MVETQESCQQIRDDYTFFYPQPTEVCVFIGAAQTLEEALFYLHPNDNFFYGPHNIVYVLHELWRYRLDSFLYLVAEQMGYKLVNFALENSLAHAVDLMTKHYGSVDPQTARDFVTAMLELSYRLEREIEPDVPLETTASQDISNQSEEVMRDVTSRQIGLLQNSALRKAFPNIPLN